MMNTMDMVMYTARIRNMMTFGTNCFAPTNANTFRVNLSILGILQSFRDMIRKEGIANEYRNGGDSSDHTTNLR